MAKKLKIMKRKNTVAKRKLSKKKIARRSWKNLTFRQKESRVRALEALSLMRKGKSMTIATREVGITRQSFKRHVGAAVDGTKTGNWNAKRYDRISREMTIFSNGRRYNIETRSSKTASIIGTYNGAVGHYAQTGDFSNLRKLEGVVVKDASGRKYLLETRPNKVISILERLEQPDVPTIYSI